MAELLAALEKDYDYILMDTPPSTLFADALALARHCDGVVLVVRQSYAKMNTISSVVEDFKHVRIPILGCVLNGIKYREAGTRHKYQDYAGYLGGYYRQYGLVGDAAGPGRVGSLAWFKNVLQGNVLLSRAMRRATTKWVFLPLIFAGLILTSMALWDYLLPVYHISRLAAAPACVSPVDYNRGAAGPVEYPAFGEQYATLLLPSVGVSRPVFFGDAKNQLKAGVGHFSGSNLPGEGGTIVYAGHNDLVFNKLKDVVPGDDVLIQTNYGNFRYRVLEAQVVNSSFTISQKPRGEKAILVMYTCYPLDLFSRSADRYVVFAEQVLDFPLVPEIPEPEIPIPETPEPETPEPETPEQM
jgi:sortase A